MSIIKTTSFSDSLNQQESNKPNFVNFGSVVEQKLAVKRTIILYIKNNLYIWNIIKFCKYLKCDILASSDRKNMKYSSLGSAHWDASNNNGFMSLALIDEGLSHFMLKFGC